jgi:hypothetical protein
MKIYIGCSLTQASEEFKRTIEKLKNDLRKDYDVMDFIGTVAGTPEDVYKWDIYECVAKCEAFIAICDLPAIGLGYELGVAVEKLNKPTLALAHRDAKVSRILLGIRQPHYTFERYDSMEELPNRIKTFLQTLN